jgi:hypothetical protein
MFEQVSNLPAFLRVGGAERDRTVDPLLAKQVLSQLSYSPTFQGCAASRFRPLALLAHQWRELRNPPAFQYNRSAGYGGPG